MHEKENPVFLRKEIMAEITKEVIPKRTEIEALLSEKFSTIPEAIKVERIISRFGSNKFRIEARIYKSKESKENIEPRIKTGKQIKQSQ